MLQKNLDPRPFGVTAAYVGAPETRIRIKLLPILQVCILGVLLGILQFS